MKLFRGILFTLALLFAGATYAQTATTATITLTWVASPTAGVSYNVYRETAPANQATLAGCYPGTTGQGPGCLLLNSTPISALTYTDTIPTTAPVWYVIRAVNAAGVSGNSNEVAVSFVTIVIPAPPGTAGCAITITGAGSTVTGTCK